MDRRSFLALLGLSPLLPRLRVGEEPLILGHKLLLNDPPPKGTLISATYCPELEEAPDDSHGA